MSKLLTNHHHLYPLLRCYLVNGQMTFCNYSMTRESLEDLKSRKQQLSHIIYSNFTISQITALTTNMAIQY